MQRSITRYGTKYWYISDVELFRPRDMVLHREDRDPITGLTLPAVENGRGTRVWRINGKRHRTDKDSNGLTLPAVELSNGVKLWCIDGNVYRDDKDPITGLSLPSAEYTNAKVWYVGNKRHRDEKDPITGLSLPAVEYNNGGKVWYINDLLHRLDGPAVIVRSAVDITRDDPDGFDIIEYWVNGEKLDVNAITRVKRHS